MYHRLRHEQPDLTLKFDILRIPKGTKFKYLNYHETYKLVLVYKISTDGLLSPDIKGLQQGFFLYLPWDLCQVEFTNKLTQSISQYDFIDTHFNNPEFYLNYEISEGNVSGITKMDILKVISKSGIEFNKDTFPINYNMLKNPRAFMISRYPRTKLILLDYLLSNKHDSDFHFFKNIQYKIFITLFAEFYLTYVTKAQDVLARTLARIKKVVANNERDRPEWQKICAYIGGNYRLKELQKIASKSFSIDPTLLKNISKRSLCSLIARYSVNTHKYTINNWLRKAIRHRRTQFALPKDICINYAEEPNELDDITGKVVKKLYRPETTQLPSAKIALLAELIKPKGELARPIIYPDADDIKGWRLLVDNWSKLVKSYRQMESPDFVVIVKPNLVANCVTYQELLNAAENSKLCTWFERPIAMHYWARDEQEKSANWADGVNFIPNRNDVLVSIPFHDPELERELGEVASSAVGATKMVLLYQEDYRKIITQITEEREKVSNKLLIFYLGRATESRTGNCNGDRGVSNTHGQLHSTKAIYRVIYKRRITRDTYVAKTGSGRPVENPEIKSQLDKIKQEELPIIRRRSEIANLLYGVKDEYNFSLGNHVTGDDIEFSDFLAMRDNGEELVVLYDEDQRLEKQLRSQVMKKMRLQAKLYSKPT